MRRLLLLGCLSLFPLAPARGQAPTPEPLAGAAQQALAPTDPSPWSKGGHVYEAVPNSAMDAWHADVLAGLPLGVRVQVPLRCTNDGAFLVEGFAGFYFILPTVGAGLRYQHTLIERGGRRLTIGPGIDVYGVYNIFSGLFGSSSGLGVIAADVDIIFHCAPHSLGTTVFGVKLGGGGFVGSRSAVVPIVAVFGGLQF